MTIANLMLEQRQALAELVETKDVDALRATMEVVLDTAVQARSASISAPSRTSGAP
jgi:hypothetical protein